MAIRLKALALTYKIHQVDMDDAVSLLQHIIRCHDVFSIIIPYALQWPVFPVFRIFALQHFIGHLHIGIIHVAVSEDEITF